MGYDRDFRLIEDTGQGLRAVLVRTPVWSKIQLSGTTVRVPEGVQLDLGATAKAFAADLSAARVGLPPLLLTRGVEWFRPRVRSG